MAKEIKVVLHGYRITNKEWSSDVAAGAVKGFVESLHQELNPLGITLTFEREGDTLLEVKGYADLLNCIRLRSTKDHIGNLCLGHILGKSEHCDFFEDLRRGVCRVAFAPEMIEPEGSHKVVCHNCGCGC